MVSVSSTLGIWSYLGVNATLIIFEVMPFLVFAIGTNNIFILIRALQRDEKQDAHEPLPVQIGRVLGRVGPSMFLSALAECAAFGFCRLQFLILFYTFYTFYTFYHVEKSRKKIRL